MQLKNLTPFPFVTRVTALRPPQLKMTIAVRGKFSLTPGVVTVPEGIPQLVQGMISGDRFAEGDETFEGAISWSSDLADFKPRTDILFHGSCHTPGARPLPMCPVELRVGAWRKALRVVGDRAWGGVLSARPSAPEPFVRMPLDYTRAFGGPGFKDNPVGKGIDGAALPNVEDPRAPVQRRRDRPAPAGFGPLSPFWPARARLTGKRYDKRYRRERAPYYAEDFDWRHFNAAPRDQQLDGYLRGDEEVQLQNLHAEHPVLRTRLPGLRARCFVQGIDGRFREVVMNLDTLTIDGDDDALYLTWRGLDDVEDAEFDDVAALLVASEALADAPRPRDEYEALMARFLADPLEIEERLGPENAATLALLRDETLDDDARADAYAKLIEERAGADAVAQLEQRDPDSLSLKQRIKRQLEGAADEDAPRPVMLVERPRVFLRPQLEQAARAITRARAQLPEGADSAPLDEAEDKLRDEFYTRLDPTYRPPGAPPPAGDEPGPGADLSYRDLTGVDLEGANLEGATLEGAVLMRARLRGANLRGASLRGVMLFRADLTGADLTGADLSLAHLGKAKLRGASLRGATLDEAFFDEADLTGADIGGARGTHVFFNKATLTDLRAARTTITQGKFEAANIAGARFDEASLEQCHFGAATGARASFRGATLERANFAKASLPEADFTWSRGERTIWNEGALPGADFTSASFPASFFMKIDAPGARFVDAILSESRFTKSRLTDADFTGAKLLSADLVKTRIDRVRFTNANLFGAGLNEAKGAGVDFRGANLTWSSLDP